MLFNQYRGIHRLPGRTNRLQLQPTIPASKIITINIGTASPGNKYFFKDDEQLNNARILGIQFLPDDEQGPILGNWQKENAQGNDLYINYKIAQIIKITLVERNRKENRLLDSYPLFNLAGYYFRPGETAATIRPRETQLFEPNVKVYWKKSFLTFVPNALVPTVNSLVALRVVYLPYGMKRK